MSEQLLLPMLSGASQRQWSSANLEVVWGWKRDSERRQRVILFGGRLVRLDNLQVAIRDWFFHYQIRDETSVARGVYDLLAESTEVAHILGHPSLVSTQHGMSIVRIAGGPSRSSATHLVTRLMHRRPRYRIPQGDLPPEAQSAIDLRAMTPIALYAGSGLSYEAGIPTLAQVHQLFGVDDMESEELLFGRNDPIPSRLARSVAATFADFVSLNVSAAEAKPSFSHFFLARLFQEGIITQILTDNIDNLFATTGVPFQRTRGIGIFNETFPTAFEKERTLLVVGVAADRRSVIRQARSRGLRIVVVNPMLPVSPLSQNLSYLRKQDIWFRMTAQAFARMHLVF